MSKEIKKTECKQKKEVGCFPTCHELGTVLECPDTDTCTESQK